MDHKREVGIRPLARVMRVGRQQQQGTFQNTCRFNTDCCFVDEVSGIQHPFSVFDLRFHLKKTNSVPIYTGGGGVFVYRSRTMCVEFS